MTEREKQACINFLVNEAKSKDLEHLEDWLRDSKNNQLFQSYIETNYIMDSSLNSFDSKKPKQKYLKVIREEKRKEKRLKVYRWTGYVAAILVVALLIANIAFNGLFDNSKDQLVPVIVNNIKPGENKAILTLEDGEDIYFEKGSLLQITNAQSNGQGLIYDNDNKDKVLKELEYNTLTIPRGGQFFVKLSDGTQVWLNSETQIKYPVRFIEDATREVELVYGEAYFEVSPSIKHNGSKFIVSNKNQDIEVLGTKFNIQAYKDENNVYTTLSEGKVMVRSHSVKDILKPGQQANLDIENGDFTIQNVNVKHELAWIYGDFVFNKKSLNEIIKVLSRWYDVDIKLEGEYVLSQKFNGQLSRGQNLEKILELIKNTGKIKSYEINGKEIVLK